MNGLNRCRLCGGDAWEQVRGLLKEQPEHLQKAGVPPTKDQKGWVPVSSDSFPTSSGPATATNTRVICSTCHNSTGWMAEETADYMRFVWNRDNPDGPLELTGMQPEGAAVPDAINPGKDDAASVPLTWREED